MSFQIGTLIGDYEIIDVLGAGGMGKVYKVRNTISDRIEAMKVLLPNLDADQELAERFLREIKVLASLQHPNIAGLRTAQRISNQLLMIMEFVEGFNIEKIMRKQRIAMTDCVNYGAQVLAALGYAHSRGVVHRDIKPPNIMLTPEGVIKLMDFGIAKVAVDQRLTQTGRTVGSLFYMSPEQIRGADVDGRSDLYSFGIMLYEMVTGRRPFEGESDYSIMAAHLQQTPQPPLYFDASLPRELNDVILMSIVKDPAQRFQTADAFRSALQAVGKGIGVGLAGGTPVTHIWDRATAPAPVQFPSGRQRTPTIMEGPAQASTGPRQFASQPQLQSVRVPSQPRLPSMQVPAQQQYQPQYGQMPLQQAQAQPARSSRGMYMVLGSVATVAILAAGAFYLPKLLQTRANNGPPQAQEAQRGTLPPQQNVRQQQGSTLQQSLPAQQQQAPVPQQQNPPAQQTSPPPQQQAPVAQQPRIESVKPPPVQQARTQEPPPLQQQHTQAPVNPPPVSIGQIATPPIVQTPPNTETRQQSTPPPPNNAAAIEELNHRKMLMRARIDAVNASMTKLEQDQKRMGLGMSGDLVARQHRMMYYMETVDGALKNGNVEQARVSMNNAERELDKLEERFGR